MGILFWLVDLGEPFPKRERKIGTTGQLEGKEKSEKKAKSQKNKTKREPYKETKGTPGGTKTQGEPRSLENARTPQEVPAIFWNRWSGGSPLSGGVGNTRVSNLSLVDFEDKGTFWLIF